MVLDSGAAVVGVVGTVLASVLFVRLEIDRRDEESHGGFTLPKTFVVAPAIVAGLSIWGMVHNMRATSACQRAWGKHDEWRRAQHPEDFPPEIDECSRPIAEWRGEVDLERKTERWNELSPACRATVTR